LGLPVKPAGVDEKSGFILAQIIEQKVEARVIESFAREGGEVLIALAQGAGKSFADVTGGAEEENHARRLASATTFFKVVAVFTFRQLRCERLQLGERKNP